MKRYRWILIAFSFLAGTLASEFFSEAVASSTQIKIFSEALRYEIPINALTLMLFFVGVLAASKSYFLGRLKWSGKTGQRAKMYPTLKTGYGNDEETQFFGQV